MFDDGGISAYARELGAMLDNVKRPKLVKLGATWLNPAAVALVLPAVDPGGRVLIGSCAVGLTSGAQLSVSEHGPAELVAVLTGKPADQGGGGAPALKFDPSNN